MTELEGPRKGILGNDEQKFMGLKKGMQSLMDLAIWRLLMTWIDAIFLSNGNENPVVGMGKIER